MFNKFIVKFALQNVYIVTDDEHYKNYIRFYKDFLFLSHLGSMRFSYLEVGVMFCYKNCEQKMRMLLLLFCSKKNFGAQNGDSNR